MKSFREYLTLVESLNPGELDAWAEQVRQDCGLKHFHVFLGNNNVLKLYTIVANEKGAGGGTKAMQALCKLADEHGLTITLTPATKDDHHGTTSQARLIRFYKRFGFKENKGRSKDFSIRDLMVRQPSKN